MKHGSWKYRILKPDERSAIKRAINESKFTQAQIATELSIHITSLSRSLNGHMGLNPDFARKIYALLNIPPELDFLANYETLRDSDEDSVKEQPPIDIQWRNLYASYINQLQGLFLGLPSNRRTELLGELEKLAEKYRANPESRAN